MQLSQSGSNGCGPEILARLGVNAALRTLLPESYQSCCNAHDACYGTAGATQRACDDAFRACLLARNRALRRARSPLQPANPLYRFVHRIRDAITHRALDATAHAMHGAVRGRGGAGAFAAAKRKHVGCKVRFDATRTGSVA